MKSESSYQLPVMFLDGHFNFLRQLEVSEFYPLEWDD